MIEQARRLLMALYQCGPDEAEELLHRASQAHDVETHVLSAKVVEPARRGLPVTDAEHHET